MQASLVAGASGAGSSCAPLERAATRRLLAQRFPALDEEAADRIWDLSGGLPFTALELARAEVEGRPASVGAAGVGAALPRAVRRTFARVALLGSAFTTDELLAVAGVDEEEAYGHLEAALTALVVEPADTGYRFRHALVREAAAGRGARARAGRGAAAGRRAARGARRRPGPGGPPVPGRRAAGAGDPLRAPGGGDGRCPGRLPGRAGPGRRRPGARHRRGRSATAAGAARGPPHGAGRPRLGPRLPRGGAGDLGDPSSDWCGPGSHARPASAATSTRRARPWPGLELEGDAADGPILLARGNLSYFTGDVDAAWDAASAARRILLTPDDPWHYVDLIALQGLIAHQRGEWFERFRLELRRTQGSAGLATALFDAHLCVAEYLLYGPVPYPEVIELAEGLRRRRVRTSAPCAASPSPPP